MPALSPEEQERLRDAMKSADAICALEGMNRTPAMDEMDKRILAGELTFGEAALEFAARAKAQAVATKAAQDQKG